MKKIIRFQRRFSYWMLIAFVSLFLVASIMLISEKVSAKNKEWFYPVDPSNPNWAELSYEEQLKACNMPQDLLTEYSSEGLADLILEYPFLIDVGAFDNASVAIAHLIETSNICKEFFSRNDATDILLEKYEKISEQDYIVELFLQTYFLYAEDSFDVRQSEKLRRILDKNYIIR